MSVYTTNTSILKTYSISNREKAKQSTINRVRFDIPLRKPCKEILENALGGLDLKSFENLMISLNNADILDLEIRSIVSEIRECIHMLTPELNGLVDRIINVKWIHRDQSTVNEFQQFLIDLAVAHPRYIPTIIYNLLATWIPLDVSHELWKDCVPSDEVKNSTKHSHEVIKNILNLIPLAIDVMIPAIVDRFPYYKKPSFVVSGYVHHLLWFLEYMPMFTEAILEIIIKQIILMDVNVPREEIEDSEECDENGLADLEELPEVPETDCMKHPIAETMDICMTKMFAFIKHHFHVSSNDVQSKSLIDKKFQIFLKLFERVILPAHNTHHVQFIMFYLCSFKVILAEQFIKLLWHNVCDLNEALLTRQASVSYLASLLARARFLPISLIKSMLKDLCSWANQYVQKCDSSRYTNSLRAHIVFYAVCQAIFYIIAFRSRELTSCNKSLLFLQSLQLSSLVTSHLNPLRVCLPGVATNFAGVTRAYQIVYCYTILERNARKRLATVYDHNTAMPEECLDTFFPFDPYLLKKSGHVITPMFLVYQPHDPQQNDVPPPLPRKRLITESDDIDDFIAEKRILTDCDFVM